MVNISMLIIPTIRLMFDLSVSCVPRPCLYMLGSSSLTQVFHMCKTGLHPLYANIESITPDHHVVLRNDKLSQQCTLGENTILSWNFSERSPYNATVVLSKIRCIKGLTSHANHKWHDMAINLRFWSPSSPAWHHDLYHRDLHHRVAIGVVMPTMLLLLLLPLSDKVKHYIALNDWHTGHTIVKDNPMAHAGCRMHRHASRYKLLQTWSSHTSNISHHVFGHITSQHTLQKQVRHPLIVVACFTWLLWVSSKNDSYLRKAATAICKLLFTLIQGPPL